MVNQRFLSDWTVETEAPKDDLELAGEVEDWCYIGEGNALGAGDLVEADLGLRGFERPRKMVDVADEHAAAGMGKEAVTLSEKAAERVGAEASW